MKKLTLLILFLSTQAAQAGDFDYTCLNRYRDAFVQLLDHARGFNDGDENPAQFLAEFTAIETQIGIRRLACTLEPDSIKNCVILYKEKYHKISDQVDVIGIASGTQKKVKLGILPEAGLAIIDLKCQASEE